MTTDVLIHRHGAVGHISLNRPKALHALTLEHVPRDEHGALRMGR